jgi:iron complex transport system permease protein
MASVSLGPVPIGAATVWQIIASELTGIGAPGTAIQTDIVWDLRLPRTLLASLVGAGLAVAGVITQAIARNPLADPYLLGVSQGASVAAVAVIVTGAAVFGTAPTAGAAFCGGLGALVLVYAFARYAGRMEPLRLVLSGVAVGFALQGLTHLLVLSSTDPATTNSALFWMFGSLARADWPTLAAPAAGLLGGLITVIVLSRPLNALLTGDETAASLGITVDRLRGALLVLASLLTGVMVAVSGGIGFVGLVAPHAVRLVIGAEHRRLLPAAALAGAVLLTGADIVARLAAAPQELPVGVVTAIIGAPVLLSLMRRGYDAPARRAVPASGPGVRSAGTSTLSAGTSTPDHASPQPPAQPAPPSLRAASLRNPAASDVTPGDAAANHHPASRHPADPASRHPADPASGHPGDPASSDLPSRDGAVPRTSSALRFDVVTVVAGGHSLVAEVTLHARSGELTGIIGPNGSGKTSLLRTAYRHLAPAAGAVTVDGADLHRLPAYAAARLVAAVPQERAAGFALTVREIVELGRLPHGAGLAAALATGSPAGRRNQNHDHAPDPVEAALRRTGMETMADRLFPTLSGGERQRTLVARALAQDTPVLVLDEPTNHLDVRHQLDVLAVVRELRLTTLVALHDLNLAAAHCDRLYVLSEGRIVAAGLPREVLTRTLLRDVFDVDAQVVVQPETGRPRLAYALPASPSGSPSASPPGSRTAAPPASPPAARRGPSPSPRPGLHPPGWTG